MKNKQENRKNHPQSRKKLGFVAQIMGNCVLEIPRAFLEDFLNICLRYGFYTYNVSIDEEARKALVCVSMLDEKNILTACRMWQIRVKVVSHHGFPRWLSLHRGRWGIAFGAALGIALFCLSQSVIWRVDIVGNSRLSDEHILSALAENGLEIGSRISKINKDSVEQRIMINDDGISWISIDISGTVAYVEVREVLDTEVLDKNTNPANLISKFDAQIIGMEVYSGFLSVKEGDFVRKGELLVSGVYKTEKAPLRFSRASGKILGRVSHTFEIEIPLVCEKKVYSGEKIEKKSLIFFGKTINFFTNYRNLPITYDIINYVYTLNPFSLGELPISVSVDTYLPYEMQAVEISEDEAIDSAYEKLRELIDSELPDAQILRKTVSGEFVDGKYVLRCTIVAICDIARQVEFEVIK